MVFETTNLVAKASDKKLSDRINKSIGNCFKTYTIEDQWDKSARDPKKASPFAFNFDKLFGTGWIEKDPGITMILHAYYRTNDAIEALKYSYVKEGVYTPEWKSMKPITEIERTVFGKRTVLTEVA